MRREISSRQPVCLAIGLVSGLALPKVWFVAVFALAVLVWIGHSGARKWIVAGLVLGLLLSPKPLQPILERGYFNGEVGIASVPRLYEYGSVCEATTHAGKMALQLPPGVRVVLGERYRIRGQVRPLKEESEGYWLGRSVVAQLRPNSDGLLRISGASPPARWASNWRDAFMGWARANLNPENAVLAEALCFNVDSMLGEDLRENLARSGTLHIVSASGMHVAIVAAAILFLGSLIPMPRPARLALTILLLALFALATGLRPPVIRAVLMAAVLLSAYVFAREPDILAALAAALCLTLVWQPESLTDIGLVLSYGIVGALTLFAQPGSASGGLPSRLWSGLKFGIATSIVATLASAPMLAFAFGRFSIAAIVGNMLMGLALAPVVVLSLLAAAVDGLVPQVSAWIATAAIDPLLGWIRLVAEEAGAPVWSSVEVPAFAFGWLPLIYFAALMLWRPRARLA